MKHWTYWGVVLLGSYAVACRDSRGRTAVGALLDLRTGGRCSFVTLHGLQQLAVLQRLQSHSLQIELQVVDSCSSTTGARLGTLKALVAAEQTCLLPPLLLGIIGNERKESFEASYAITKDFHIPYVLPYAVGPEMKAMKNVYFMSSYPLKQHTQAMQLLLKQMGLRRVAVAYEISTTTALKADHMMEALKDNFCFLKSISFLDAYTFKQQLSSGSEEEGLLLLIENNSLLKEILEELSRYEKEVVISLGKVGLQTIFFKKEVYILQMASKNSPQNLTSSYDKEMLQAYKEQNLKSCLESEGMERICKELSSQEALEADWSVGPMSASVEALGRAAERAASCGLACRDTWFRDVQRSDFPPVFSLYLASNLTLLRVGSIDGDSLIVHKDHMLGGDRPAVSHAKCETVRVTGPPPTTLPPPVTVPQDLFEDLEAYQLAAVLSGAVAGALLMVALVLCILYRTMRSNRSESSASIRTSASD